jgi:hypothetical protein
MKNYNITLTESELLDVVTALEAISEGVLLRRRHGPVGSTSLSSTSLSRRIADQAAEQFHDAREQPLLPYGAPGE